MNTHKKSQLVSIGQLNREQIIKLLTRAQDFCDKVLATRQVLEPLKGQALANLFFEPSTRTQYSFTLAAERLGALALNPQMSRSSLVKGESLLDTARAFVAMGVSALVVRHEQALTAQQLAEQLAGQVTVINAGDGSHEHPTQALLDLLTILQHKQSFEGLTVAIVGDISHSRVANSLIAGLQRVGVNDVRVIAPKALLPGATDSSAAMQTFSSLRDGLDGADVVVALRIQRERMADVNLIDDVEFNQQYGLTERTLKYAKPDAIVMHPGPINRGIEIDSSVADGPQSVILQQVTNGVAVRMAVLESLLS